MLQRCLNTGVLVGLPGVCDMEWVFGVTKVLEDWCLVGLYGGVTWNRCLVLQRYGESW